MRADGLYSVWGAVFVGKCVLVRCSIREEGMSWKGVPLDLYSDIKR